MVNINLSIDFSYRHAIRDSLIAASGIWSLESAFFLTFFLLWGSRFAAFWHSVHAALSFMLPSGLSECLL